MALSDLLPTTTDHTPLHLADPVATWVSSDLSKNWMGVPGDWCWMRAGAEELSGCGVALATRGKWPGVEAGDGMSWIEEVKSIKLKKIKNLVGKYIWLTVWGNVKIKMCQTYCF